MGQYAVEESVFIALVYEDVVPTVTPAGALGAALGTTAFEGADAAELPTTLVASTVKVYESPLVRPVSVHDLVDVALQVCTPRDELVESLAVTV